MNDNVEAYNENEIIEGNKLIARFEADQMEFESDRLDALKHIERGSALLPYHEDFNCLMGVVEKIEQLQPEGYNTLIEGFYCWIETPDNTFEGHQPDSKIASVWSAVAEYSKWYNDQKIH